MIRAAWMFLALAPAMQAPPQAVPPQHVPSQTASSQKVPSQSAPSAPVQVPVNPTVEEESPPPAPPVEPWQLGIDAGFAQIRDAAAKQQFESARTITESLLAPTPFLRWKLDFAARGGWRASAASAVDPLLDMFGANGLDENARAEVWYARGVVETLAREGDKAVDAFEKARAGAHDKTLRLDAMYDLGVLALEAGEAARATIPEISGKPPAPPAPLPAASPGANPTEPPDPVQVARAFYVQAREHFVERLKSEWNDPNTQANVELCLKRLRELDEIEKKREEKKKEEQQKKDQEKKDQDKKDQQKKDDQKKDQKDGDKKPDDKGDSKDDPKPKDPKDEDPKKEQPKPEDQKPKDPKDDATKQDPNKPQPTEQKPGDMSREEMTQLYDRLQQLEQEAQKIQAQLKASRRAKVKKDW